LVEISAMSGQRRSFAVFYLQVLADMDIDCAVQVFRVVQEGMEVCVPTYANACDDTAVEAAMHGRFLVPISVWSAPGMPIIYADVHGAKSAWLTARGAKLDTIIG
jgi:hypothetical protein